MLAASNPLLPHILQYELTRNRTANTEAKTKHHFEKRTMKASSTGTIISKDCVKVSRSIKFEVWLDYTVMNKSLRPLCKSDDFQHLACDCISHILLLHHKFVFFVVFHFAPIRTSVHISWLIFLLFTDFFAA